MDARCPVRASRPVNSMHDETLPIHDRRLLLCRFADSTIKFAPSCFWQYSPVFASLLPNLDFLAVTEPKAHHERTGSSTAHLHIPHTQTTPNPPTHPPPPHPP